MEIAVHAAQLDVQMLRRDEDHKARTLFSTAFAAILTVANESRELRLLERRVLAVFTSRNTSTQRKKVRAAQSVVPYAVVESSGSVNMALRCCSAQSWR